jgi:hypothetical protein
VVTEFDVERDRIKAISKSKSIDHYPVSEELKFYTMRKPDWTVQQMDYRFDGNTATNLNINTVGNTATNAVSFMASQL